MTVRKLSHAWIAISVLALWVVLGLSFSSALWGDNVEQFNWAHGLEWGYAKHPPLATWVLIGLQTLIGFHVSNTHWASLLCLGLTLYLVWKISEEILGGEWAGLSVLLTGLSYGFTSRAQLYNHNVILILAISALVWMTLHALRHIDRGALLRWAAVGFLAALCVLSKYQAIVPLSGVLLALTLSGALQDSRVRKGVLVGLVVFLIVLIPHVVWLFQTDFMIFQYATHSATGGDWIKRLHNLVSFVVQQVRIYWVMLFALSVLFLNKTLRKPSNGQLPENGVTNQKAEAWFWGLLYFPAIAFILINQVGGVELQNHWGVALLLFFPMWLVWKIKESGRLIMTSRMINTILIVHAVAMIFFYFTSAPGTPDTFRGGHRRHDTLYPAKQMADSALATWSESTRCPLRYVQGPAFEAGLISVYSGQYPAVIEGEDFRKHPWISPKDVLQSGQLRVTVTGINQPVLEFSVQMPLKSCAER